MRQFVFALLVLLVGTKISLAQRYKSKSSQRKRIKSVEYDLPNGLHVILHQDRSLSGVSTYVLYHVGSKNKSLNQTSFARYFEHLMFGVIEIIKRRQIKHYAQNNAPF